jgi:hypothetical protein
MTAAARRPRPFTPRDRKLALLGRGVEQQAIAAELGVSVFVVSRVVKGESLENSAAGRKVARRVAEILGQPITIVFPEGSW